LNSTGMKAYLRFAQGKYLYLFTEHIRLFY
jgi:hypothetical protein